MTKGSSWRANAAITRRELAAGVAASALALAAQSRSVAAQSTESLSDHVSYSLSPPDWSSLEIGPQVRIASVVDGDTVELERGPDVRFVGTQAPKLSLGRDHVEDWPLARLAKQHLEGLVEQGGRDAQLYFGGRKGDRHGRHLAHIVLGEGTHSPIWLQGAMVLAGLARVYTFADNRSMIPDLLAREQAARAAAHHIWGHAYYAVRDASDVSTLSDLTDHFELVEGVVRHVAANRDHWYLNFGETWREDFTITIDRRHDGVFENSGVDLNALAGKAIRVRGWVMEDGGPKIVVDHPEAIELLL